jgi:dienelactone hydrolase
MNTMTARRIYLFLCCCVTSASLQAEEKQLPEQTGRAIALVDAFVKGDYTAVGEDFDPTMRKALPTDKRKEIWEKLIDQVGPFQKRVRTRVTKADKYDIILVTCQFEKAALDVRVVFDADKKVSGLQFRPVQAAYEFKPPPYARPESYREEQITVGSGEWVLPGTLTVPKGDGPFPAAVLVHGSGPHDRDETIGPNKPFRDLAWGFASQGIAVFRYEKRTRQHAARVAAREASLTFKEETVDDALEALATLRKHKQIDAKRLFVIGHSLGAMVAPHIVERDPQIAGVVLLAGNARPLEDVIVEQITYITSLKGKLTDKDREELEKVKKQAKRVKDAKLSADTPASELPLGVPASYWLSLRAYDQTTTAAKLKQPIFVAQGERDYQVSMEDFAAWKKALEPKRNATLRSYPKLNHLFMEGEGKAKPDEYDKAGHVSRQLVDDLAVWIKNSRSR